MYLDRAKQIAKLVGEIERIKKQIDLNVFTELELDDSECTISVHWLKFNSSGNCDSGIDYSDISLTSDEARKVNQFICQMRAPELTARLAELESELESI